MIMELIAYFLFRLIMPIIVLPVILILATPFILIAALLKKKHAQTACLMYKYICNFILNL
jgi:cytochrome c oxidase assembly factor CtaG